jgi:hypothetical protein
MKAAFISKKRNAAFAKSLSGRGHRFSAKAGEDGN